MLCAGYIAEVYADMRAVEQAEKQPHSYTTARTLLSILRLAQALARLRFATLVEKVQPTVCASAGPSFKVDVQSQMPPSWSPSVVLLAAGVSIMSTCLAACIVSAAALHAPRTDVLDCRRT